MARSLFSPSWYRVAELKPRLRAHAELHRHRVRGEVWYILQDHQTGHFHRVSPAANLMICLMDGRRTMTDIWDRVCRKAGDDPPTQDEAIRLLSQLHAADLLQGDALPDLGEMAERHDSQERKKLLQKLKNPLAMRFPIFDPDRALDATLRFVRPLFTRTALVLWFVLVAAGLVLAALHWPELTSSGFDQAFTAQNILILICVYPLVKLLHEAGHAYATKVWGGEVHEFGVMLMVLIPMPYVDASASAAFREKWKRIVVSGAGMMVELALAAVAMVVWIDAEPGFVRALAFNIMLIGGVSTVLFNGNPLLRYDGYYILSDLAEIPNLATRANRYVAYLCQRWLFGAEQAETPATAASERKWLAAYAVLSFAYRIFLVLGIALFVAGQLYFAGIVMAIWAVAGMLGMPAWKALKFVFVSPLLREKRRRAVAVTAGGILAVLLALFAVPFPYATVAEGIVAVPENAGVRAENDGLVTALLTPPDTEVASGVPLFSLDDPGLPTRAAILEAQLTELKLRLAAARVSDRVQTEVLEEQVRHATAVLENTRKRLASLIVSAGQGGEFLVPGATDLVGRYVRKGDLLGYVVGDQDPVLRVIVHEADIDLVRQRTARVDVRFAEDLADVYPAVVRREVPGAVATVPSPALATSGGGRVVVDSEGRPLERLFEFEVGFDGGLPKHRLGGRVHVRFDHGGEPIAFRILRSLRQIFLTQFHV